MRGSPADGAVSSAIRVTVEDGIRTILLARPERLNALSVPLLRELAEAVEAFAADPDVRVLVVGAEGRTFSAGADIDEIREGAHRKDQAEQVVSDARLGARLCAALESPGFVTIAAVQGYAVGGAAAIVAACDLRVLADDARIVIPELTMGVPLAWGGIERLARDIGPAVLRDLLLTGRDLRAGEASERGFATSVVPAEELMAHALERARLIATRPSFAAGVALQRILAVSSRHDAPLLDDDAETLGRAVARPEARAAVETYLKALDHRSTDERRGR